MDICWEYENGLSSEYQILIISSTKSSNDLGFGIDSRSTCMSKHVKTCHLSQWSAMSSYLHFFGAAPKLEIFAQNFGMKGPMQLLSGMSQQTAGEAFWCCGALWKLGGSVDVAFIGFFFRSTTPYGRTRDVL